MVGKKTGEIIVLCVFILFFCVDIHPLSPQEWWGMVPETEDRKGEGGESDNSPPSVDFISADAFVWVSSS